MAGSPIRVRIDAPDEAFRHVQARLQEAIGDDLLTSRGNEDSAAPPDAVYVYGSGPGHMSGAVRAILATHPQAIVLGLTDEADPEATDAALGAGAIGCFPWSTMTVASVTPVVNGIRHRNRDRNALKARDDILAAVSKAARILLDPDDPEQAVRATLEAVARASGAHRAAIAVVDEEDEGPVSTVYCEWVEDESRRLINQPGDRPRYALREMALEHIWASLKEGAAVVVNRSEAGPVLGDIMDHLGAAQGLALPLRCMDPVRGYMTLYTADSEKTWSKPEMEALGAAADMLGAFRRRLRIERALKRQSDEYKLLVESQEDLLVKVAPDGQFLFVSPSYCRTFGKTEAELLGHGFMPLVHEDDREATAKAMEDLFRPPYSCYVEQRAMTVAGWRWFAWRDRSVLDEEGNVVAIVALGRDTTDKRAAQQKLIKAHDELERRVDERTAELQLVNEQLRASESRMRALTDALPFYVWAIDDQMRVVMQNAHSKQRWGELTGKRLEDSSIPEAAIATWHEQRDAALSGESSRCSFWLETGEERRRYDRTVAPVRVGDRLAGVVGAALDVTEQAQMLETLRHREAIIEAVNESMQAFLTAESLDEAIPNLLERLGRATGAGRVDVFPLSNPPATHLAADRSYGWTAPGQPSHVDSYALAGEDPSDSPIRGWIDTLTHDGVVRATLDDMSPELRAAIQPTGLGSLLAVPIMADDSPWGTIGLAGPGEREWSSPEVDAIRTAAGMIGSFVTRNRTTRALKRRDAILEAVSKSVQDFLSADDHEAAVDRALARIGRSTGVDRVNVYEEFEDSELGTCVGIRHEWCSDGIRGQTNDAALRIIPVAKSAFGDWSETLRNDEVIKARVRDLSPEARRIIEPFGAMSILVCPVFVGDVFWGTIGLDDTHGEREWSPTELEALHAAAGIIGTFIQRNQGLQALRESEHRFRTLTADSPLAVVIQQKGIFKYANEAAAELLGSPPEEILSWNQERCRQLPHPFDRAFVMDQTRRRLNGRTEGPDAFTFRLLTPDGDTRWVEQHTGTIVHEGQPAVLATMLDVTARHAMEDALRESEEKFRMVSDRSLVAIMLIQDSSVVYANQAAADMAGTTLGEMLQWQAEDYGSIIHPADRTFAMEQQYRKLRGDADVLSRYTVRLLPHDGEIRWGDLHSRAMPYQGRPALLVTIVDITERKRAEDALRESEENYRALVESAGEAIAVIDYEGRFLLVNSTAAGRLDGETPETLIGKVMWDVFPKDVADRQVRNIRAVMDDGKAAVFENQTAVERGVRWYHTSLTPLRNASGDVRAALMIGRDITDRKIAEEQLLRYQEQLRTLAGKLVRVEERERRQLAASLHDSIGQTLALTKIMIGKLRRSLKDSDLAGDIERVSDLVHETIDATRSLTFELSPPVLYDLGLEAAVEWLAEDVEQRHGLTIGVQRNGPATNLRSEQRIMLFGAVRELLLNVVKHAHADCVAVTIDSTNGELRIRVNDDGCGFDFGTCMEQVSTDQGYGLFSVRERMRSLGGALDIRANEGGGTRAELTLPIAAPTGSNPQETGQWQSE